MNILSESMNHTRKMIHGFATSMVYGYRIMITIDILLPY